MKKILNLISPAFIFVLFIFVGYFVGGTNQTHSINIDKLTSISSLRTLFTIFGRNSLAFILLLTTLVFGQLIILAFFISNGFIIGLTCSKLTRLETSVLLLPHGVFEFGAFFYLSYAIIFKLSKTKNSTLNIKSLHLKKHIGFSYGLLFFAAILESFLTPYLSKLILGK